MISVKPARVASREPEEILPRLLIAFCYSLLPEGFDAQAAKAYYYLLQLGHLLMQLLHHNSLHLALAKQYGRKTLLTLWGALKKIPQRLLEAFRYYLLPQGFDAQAAKACHISLNTS